LPPTTGSILQTNLQIFDSITLLLLLFLLLLLLLLLLLKPAANREVRYLTSRLSCPRTKEPSREKRA